MPAAASPSHDLPVLAVLAFDNQSSDAEMQFFSDGVSEEIIQRLSRGANLKVIGRTSSFQFRGERKAEAAERLACSHVLDGSIRRVAGRVRISAHLMEASSRTTLWSDRYDRGLEDIFAVQDEIAESIAQSTRPDVLQLLDAGGRPGGLRPVPARQPEVLRTRRSAHLRRPAGSRDPARAAFRRGLGAAGLPARLPAHVPALRASGPRARRAWRARPRTRWRWTRRTVDALASRCFVMPPFGRFIEGDVFLERLQRAPGSGDGRRYIGWFLRHTGRLRESLEETERSYRLDALDPMTANLVALARMASGRVARGGAGVRRRSWRASPK